jgi:hypothetical protein
LKSTKGSLFDDLVKKENVMLAISTATCSGITLGAALAIVLSWHRNRSILWAIFHGICSWFYVIYFAATRKPNEK